MDEDLSIITWKSISNSTRAALEKDAASQLNAKSDTPSEEEASADRAARVLFDMWRRHGFKVDTKIKAVLKKLEKEVTDSRLPRSSAQVGAYRLLKQAWQRYVLAISTNNRLELSNENAKDPMFEESVFLNITLENMFTIPLWTRHYQHLPESDIHYNTLVSLRDLLKQNQEVDLEPLTEQKVQQQRDVQYQLRKFNSVVETVRTAIERKIHAWYAQANTLRRYKALKQYVMSPLSDAYTTVLNAVRNASSDAGVIYTVTDDLSERCLELLRMLKDKLELLLPTRDKDVYRGLLRDHINRNTPFMDADEAFKVGSDKYTQYHSLLLEHTKKNYSQTWHVERIRVLKLVKSKLQEAFSASNEHFPTLGYEEKQLFQYLKELRDNAVEDLEFYEQDEVKTDMSSVALDRLRAEWMHAALKADLGGFYCSLVKSFEDGMDRERGLSDADAGRFLMDQIQLAIESLCSSGVPSTYANSIQTLNQVHLNVRKELRLQDSVDAGDIKQYFEITQKCLETLNKKVKDLGDTMESEIFEFKPFVWPAIDQDQMHVPAVVQVKDAQMLRKVVAKAQAILEHETKVGLVPVRTALGIAANFLKQCEDGQAEFEIKQVWENVNNIWDLENVCNKLNQ